MFEKVNMYHPDKVADRIAGALVDLCYRLQEAPKCAFEVLVGHGVCHIIGESSVDFGEGVIPDQVNTMARRITGDESICVITDIVPQDALLAKNQEGGIRCGDNGIFRGVKSNGEEKALAAFAGYMGRKYMSDGKYVVVGDKLVICQSNADEEECMRDAREIMRWGGTVIVNPLGSWIGGLGVDTGATNRKLGSDMGRAVTGGGLHGKDLTKADVSVNIYLHNIAETYGETYEAWCAIGDSGIQLIGESSSRFVDYGSVMERAKWWLDTYCGGSFEKFAERGLV